MILASENNFPIPYSPICRHFAAHTLGATSDSFVQIYFKKTTRYHVSHLSSGERAYGPHTCAAPNAVRCKCHDHPPISPTFDLRLLTFDHSIFPMILIVQTLPQNTLKKCAFLPKKRALPKGKLHLKRGSNRSLNFSSPFLALVKTPCFLSKNRRFPNKNDCLDIIEPRIEPRTPRGRFFTPQTVAYPGSRAEIWDDAELALLDPMGVRFSPCSLTGEDATTKTEHPLDRGVDYNLRRAIKSFSFRLLPQVGELYKPFGAEVQPSRTVVLAARTVVFFPIRGG